MTDAMNDTATAPLRAQTDSLRSRWFRLSLLQQFALMGTVVLLIGMLVIGLWVSGQIKNGVLKNSASSTALFMRSFIEPVVQELASGNRLDPDSIQTLEQLLNQTEFSRRVVSVKIWKEEGLISFSSRDGMAGQRFPPTPNLQRAWQGEVTAEFDALEHEENAQERVTGIPLLEIYSPLRENGTGRIIAVAEFYERASQLKQQLFHYSLASWLVVGTVTLVMFGTLSGIVLRGSRTIKRQQGILEDQVAHLSSLLAQNNELHRRLQRASRRTAEINERYLRRISADLHDGPAQLLAYALLRLDSLRTRFRSGAQQSGQKERRGEKAQRGKNPQNEDSQESREHQEIEILRTSLTDALNEVRTLCNGLTLPELDTLPVEALLRDVVGAHERRTGTRVALSIEEAPEDLSHSLKIGIYRFVQETLNNAYRHAEGRGQKVTFSGRNRQLRLEVSDEGKGFASLSSPDADHGLGLAGLRERIESLDGTMSVFSTPGEGTRVVMCCDLKTPRED